MPVKVRRLSEVNCNRPTPRIYAKHNSPKHTSYASQTHNRLQKRNRCGHVLYTPVTTNDKKTPVCEQTKQSPEVRHTGCENMSSHTSGTDPQKHTKCTRVYKTREPPACRSSHQRLYIPYRYKQVYNSGHQRVEQRT